MSDSPWSKPPGSDAAVEDGAEALEGGSPAAPAVASTGVAASRRSRAPLLAAMGVLVVVLLGMVGGLVWYVTRDGSSGGSYPANKPDNAYDLESMQLRNSDLPKGLVRQSRNDQLTFSNDEWSRLLKPEDPTAKSAQLTAQKRIKNLVSIYSWDDAENARIGLALSVLSQSTLYETEEAAKAEANRLCGLRIDEKDPLKEFKVPGLGDQSAGFQVTTDSQIGKTVDTAVCFRTGRIVHGVIQTAFLGAENPTLVTDLAKKMLDHVDKTFSGKPPTKDPEPTKAPGS